MFTANDIAQVIALNSKYNFYTVRDGKVRWQRLLVQDIALLNANLSKRIETEDDMRKLKQLVRKAIA